MIEQAAEHSGVAAVLILGAVIFAFAFFRSRRSKNRGRDGKTGTLGNQNRHK